MVDSAGSIVCAGAAAGYTAIFLLSAFLLPPSICSVCSSSPLLNGGRGGNLLPPALGRSGEGMSDGNKESCPCRRRGSVDANGCGVAGDESSSRRDVIRWAIGAVVGGL